MATCLPGAGSRSVSRVFSLAYSAGEADRFLAGFLFLSLPESSCYGRSALSLALQRHSRNQSGAVQCIPSRRGRLAARLDAPMQQRPILPRTLVTHDTWCAVTWTGLIVARRRRRTNRQGFRTLPWSRPGWPWPATATACMACVAKVKGRATLQAAGCVQLGRIYIGRANKDGSPIF